MGHVPQNLRHLNVLSITNAFCRVILAVAHEVLVALSAVRETLAGASGLRRLTGWSTSSISSQFKMLTQENSAGTYPPVPCWKAAEMLQLALAI